MDGLVGGRGSADVAVGASKRSRLAVSSAHAAGGHCAPGLPPVKGQALDPGTPGTGSAAPLKPGHCSCLGLFARSGDVVSSPTKQTPGDLGMEVLCSLRVL